MISLGWLKDNGYYVLWLGKNDALSVRSFSLSVNEWASAIGVNTGSNPYPYGEAGYYSFFREASKNLGNNTSNGDYKAIVMAQEFINNNPPEPYIIFIPGMGGHPPYGAPSNYYSKFTGEQVKEVYTLRPPYIKNKPKYYSKTHGIPGYRNLTGFNDSFFYDIKAIYLGRMNYMDWLFQQLYQTIESNDKKTNTETAIIVSSDHGDFSGDYYCVEKWPGSLDDNLINIPLYMRIPGMNTTNKNGINMPTQSFDVFETIIDIANIKTEWNRFGQSLKDYIISGKDGDLNKYVYSEGGFYYYNELFPNGTDHINDPTNMYWPRALEEMNATFANPENGDGTGSPRCTSIQNYYYKLVYRALGVTEFYDLTKDPNTLNNIYGTSEQSTYNDIINEMFMNLLQFYQITGDVTPILMDPRGTPAPNPSHNL